MTELKTELDLRERFIPKLIYRHFKGGMYASMFLSKATDSDKLIEVADQNFFMTAVHTESGANIILFVDKDGNYMHSSHECSDDLAIYVSLENGTRYARPIDMFVEKTDREKYPLDKFPEYIQPYRLMALEEFEMISTRLRNELENRQCLFLNDYEAVAIFGDGKIGISTGIAKNREGSSIPAMGLVELQDKVEVGGTSFDKDKTLSGEIMMAFKSEKAIDIVVGALNNLKKAFIKDVKIESDPIKEECVNVGDEE